ncbi:c-type cytochrome [Segetibacter sp. 3557_3]|uniref:c-type cytochrome n=1 Tax=Segetibacter sp. 3557_3 TaxID=2547429 RepID=UPI0010591D3F|nr:c-type cytochrome [Segetibacter sp. 3557_3]TDH28606.1 c-type cytochrome [Segetibacter sp. 3557_3]
MKKITVMAALVCLVCISFAFRQRAARYKNLKVLPKNTTKQEMDSIMRHFSTSLGVRCNFCHVRTNDAQRDFDFASDSSKNKQIARGMFKMMVKINKKYFKESQAEARSANRIPEVSCFTCHHGKENPENRPPAPPAPGQQRPPAPRTGLP